jgi:hypothetical protein
MTYVPNYRSGCTHLRDLPAEEQAQRSRQNLTGDRRLYVE